MAFINLSRLRFRSAKQLPNLECSGFCVSRNAMLSYSKVRNMDRMTVGLGGRVELALSLTALMAVGRFETYQAPLGRRTHERAVSVDDEAASIDTHSSPAPGRWGGVGASLGASRRRATASWWSSSWPAPLWVYYALSGNGERDRPQTPRTPPKREPTGDRRSPSTPEHDRVAAKTRRT